uniref:PMT family dolichyl-phosphate-mannose-protein mannosyltransferase n=1 Tax=Clostridium cellulovorans TaxID=1493 RepID=A0A173N0C2_CLOCL|nr:PMT family dolichyl-phosphate-mannose-protein mannosyltransferase [Clostridium cellulovorans]
MTNIREVQLGFLKIKNSIGTFQDGFSRFVNITLKLLFLLIVFTTYDELKDQYKDVEKQGLYFIVFFLLCGLVTYIALKKNIKTNKILVAIITFSLIIRLIWIWSIDSIPVSDFAGMYERSQLVLEGDYYIFKGNHYYARFPHLTIIVLYFAVIRRFFTYPLITIKIINVLCSTVSVILIYFIVKEVFGSKVKGIWASFIAAIYPPIILYTAVYCGENMAIPFYLLSVYFFILVIKGKKPLKFLFFSALSLTIGNFFRMVAPVVVIAYIMYLLIYFEKSIKEKAVAIIYIVGAFIIPLILVSTLLRVSTITEFNLWKGSESSWTSILKGTNFDSWGRWNEEDARIVDKYNDDYEDIENACKEIVKERLTTASYRQLAEFYIRKYTGQWRNGDFSGVFWATLDLEEEGIRLNLFENSDMYNQLMYVIVITTTYIGLFNKRQYLKNKLVNLFYFIFCGYGLLFLITESQDRYSFIVCWLFLILPFSIFEGNKFFPFAKKLEEEKISTYSNEKVIS